MKGNFICLVILGTPKSELGEMSWTSPEMSIFRCPYISAADLAKLMECLKGRTDRDAMKRGRGLIRVDAFRYGFDTDLIGPGVGGSFRTPSIRAAQT
jgi:hypothetical protein